MTKYQLLSAEFQVCTWNFKLEYPELNIQYLLPGTWYFGDLLILQNTVAQKSVPMFTCFDVIAL
jgi:hypothetical protein